MAQEFTHPETKSGEIFFTNATGEDFATMNLASKRMGRQTYDGEGNSIQHNDWFPVFIQETELNKQELDLKSLRRKWRDK